MYRVPAEGWAALAPWFTPERPGPQIYGQLRHTGLGRALVDRRDAPRAVLVEIPGNFALRGDPAAVDPAELAALTGFVEAAPGWEPVLRAATGDVGAWPRVVSALPAAAPPVRPRHPTRRLGPADAVVLRGYDPAGGWIWETHGGPDELAAAAVGHGAFVDGRLVSIAVPFFAGAAHVDIGVVTEAGYRGRGLSTACAAAVVADIRAGRRIPTWSTSPDNAGSLAVAARLGFVRHRTDVLYAVRVPIPA